jgi:predicted amidohydrolase YtcJ
VVAGGWTEEQFAEKRRPTAAEAAAAAPDHPVYIQHLYDWLLLTPKAMEALGIHDDSDVTPGGKLERDGDNKPTGVVIANGNALGKIFDKLPKPTLAQQVESSRKFFSEMNSLGITGIVDGGGVSMYPANYQAVFKLWHDKQLTVRRLSPLRAEAGQRACRPAEPDAVAAAGVRRCHAAFQRPRRNPGVGRLDRRRHHARRQGEAGGIAALGGIEGLHHPDPLESEPHRA